MLTREKDGKFLRTRKPWSLNNFSDGYADSTGRVRVYSPGHHRASKEGYVLRSLIAWETYHNKQILEGFQIHHVNKIKSDDSEKNLMLVTSKEHGSYHATGITKTEKTCIECNQKFLIGSWRLKNKEENRGSFCSQKCFHNHPRKESHKVAISFGLLNAYATGRR